MIRFRDVICTAAVLCIVLLSSSCAKVSRAETGGKPKNIILMISDGCGFNHVDAASLYEYGRTGVQSYEAFGVRLGMSTYPIGQSYDPDLVWRYFNYVSDAVGCTDSAASDAESFILSTPSDTLSFTDEAKSLTLESPQPTRTMRAAANHTTARRLLRY